MTVERDLSPVTGDLDEEGMVDLRKVFPRAIARIEQEAAALERRKTVERIRGEAWKAAGRGNNISLLGLGGILDDLGDSR